MKEIVGNRADAQPRGCGQVDQPSPILMAIKPGN